MTLTLFLVVLHERLRLVVVNGQALLERLRVVVRASDQRLQRDLKMTSQIENDVTDLTSRESDDASTRTKVIDPRAKFRGATLDALRQHHALRTLLFAHTNQTAKFPECHPEIRCPRRLPQNTGQLDFQVENQPRAAYIGRTEKVCVEECVHSVMFLKKQLQA